jgi:hypothetical protein
MKKKPEDENLIREIIVKIFLKIEKIFNKGL